MIEQQIENRNSGCSCDYNMNIANTATDNNCEDTTRKDMSNEIKDLKFAIVELGLYLDTHPEDERALCLHRKYTRELRNLEDKYQKVYGPLTINFPCNKWRWIEEPCASFILGVIL